MHPAPHSRETGHITKSLYSGRPLWGSIRNEGFVKAWTRKITRRELNSFAVWAICCAGLIVLILPRLLPLSVNFLYYDDFLVLPVIHMEHHRFGMAAELAFWSWAYGPDYPRSYIPKLASVVYLMAGVWAMVEIFRAWKVPFVTALIAMLLFLVHPILTDYLVWNTLSPANLAWVFVLIGYWAQLGTGRYGLAASIALGFLALGTYQIVLGLPAMLVLTEGTLRLVRNDKEKMPWKRRLMWVGAPIVLYAGYLAVGQWALNY